MGRNKYNPDQMPLIVPDSSWTVPKELPDLRRVVELGLDTENKDDGLASGRGPGWVYGAGRVLGVGVSWRAGKTLQKTYVPISHPDTENFPKEQVARWLRDITRGKKRLVFQNAPYDIGWLDADLDVQFQEAHIDDIGCMAVMIDESSREGFSLDAIAKRCGVPGKDESLLREAAHAYGIRPTNDEIKANMWRLPARYVGPYGEQDPASTLLCAEHMRPELARQGLLRAYQLEMDLIPMVHAMRKRGIRLDVAHCEEAIHGKSGLYAMRDQALAELQRRLGGPMPTIETIRDTRWLWTTFHDQQVEYTEKEGKASFGKEWMRQGYVGRYREGKQGHWLPQLIARAKQCHDAADKFIQGFLLDFAHRGRIHASVNQFKNEDGGTKTHRFSYSDPPLQQMPSRPEIFLKDWTLTADIAKIIRGAFLPERGEKWFSPDYSQQEYRLIVEYAYRLRCSKADEAMDKYLRDPNTDFHNMVVDMTGLIRQRAKDCNFAKSYGAGKDKFADMTGMELEEAVAVMSQYDDEMPFVKQLMSRCTKAADRRGYIVMLDGARMHFNEWEAAWLSKDERARGYREGYDMSPCSIEDARKKQAIEGHPWHGTRLKRAYTHKAGNALIQGGAARMGKMAMREMWRAGYVPLLQIHDEFPCSVAKEKDGRRIAEMMRDVGAQFDARVPFRVDEEYGHNWAEAKKPWKEAKFAA